MDGRLRHLIDCVETSRATITRPEHAYHAVEVMLAAQAAGRDGMAREITSDFPDPVYDAEMGSAPKTQQAHDPRSSAGS